MQLTRSSAVRITAAVLAAGLLAACNSSNSPTTAPGKGSSSTVKQAAKPKPAVCPLTGVAPKKGQSVKRAPLAVKIDNVAGALPQSGVNGADVVVEELVEGGLTRLMAIFQCGSASTVGPIRSARISDADVLALLHGSVLGFSGANPADLPPIKADGDTVLISQDSNPQYFYRGGTHAAPHNVYSSTAKILAAGIAQRKHLKAPKPLFTYGTIDGSATPAHSVSMHWPSASAIWTWSNNQWLRTQNGSTDRQTDGAQLSAANVVIMRVNIASTGLYDVNHNASPRDVTTGSNPLWVMRNGKIIKGSWHRAGVKAPLVFKDKSGHVIHLAPGRTWVELLPGRSKPAVSRH
jgi:Protein of unknown function (DUF3048) N-terminal domain/Protein of unknown function (DUF3048) C-terminal domain